MNNAQTVKTLFSRTTTVEIDINAPAGAVWSVLTNSQNYAKWNSTIVSMEGTIKLGNTTKLVSKLDPKRTFKLKVKEFVPDQTLVWGDPMGKRVYTLAEKQGTTHFTMTEKIGGPIYPLFASKIPSFDESFEQFSSDLKKEAEK